jgi:multidrug efflux pump subunit AcrB
LSCFIRTITVTFQIGTDLNVAQMVTQNRVQNALSRLPEDVQRLGVQVRKTIPSTLLAIHIFASDKSRDTLYLSNYATLHIQGRAGARAGRRRRAIPGRARLCNAHLARPG